MTKTGVDALAHRLRSAAGMVCEDVPGPVGKPATDAAQLLEAVVARLADDPAPDLVWLTLTALSGTMPTSDDVENTVRYLELHSVAQSSTWLLRRGFEALSTRGFSHARIEVLVGAVVVDVDFSARHDLHTGIQRTVREVAPRWATGTSAVLAAWTSRFGALRRLSAHEHERVLDWASYDLRGRRPSTGGTTPWTDPEGVVLVPWRSTVVLPEVPLRDAADRLTALSRFSGNRVVAVGYDCIPVASADLLPPAEAEKFARYLTLVKHADRLVAISRSAAAEFAGFVSMLPAQGLPGPIVSSCVLPVEIPAHHDGPVPARVGEVTSVVAVGSHDPRKNHVAVLTAAEQLWARGHRFRLRFIGAGGWTTREFDTELARARARGRDVVVSRSVSDADLWAAYRSARFSVFCSLHEGYGLPVAESLACATPVVTSDFGSMAEIAADGGALTVDPRDDQAIARAMERLLVDDALLDSLRADARARPPRSWDDYADDLWRQVLEVAT